MGCCSYQLYRLFQTPNSYSVTIFTLGFRLFCYSAANKLDLSTCAESVAFCVSQKWCRILPRRISAVRIVFVVFLRFFLPKAGSVRTPVWEGMSVVMRTWRRILQRGISALVIIFLLTVRVDTCLCVSLQRAYLYFVFMT